MAFKIITDYLPAHKKNPLFSDSLFSKFVNFDSFFFSIISKQRVFILLLMSRVWADLRMGLVHGILLLLSLNPVLASVITFSDCPASASPLMLAAATGDTITIAHCTVGQLLISNVANCTVAIINATFVAAGPHWANIVISENVSSVNISVLNSTAADVSSLTLLSIGAVSIEANATYSSSVSQLVFIVEGLKVNNSLSMRNFSAVGLGAINTTVFPPFSNKVVVADAVFVFSKCSFDVRTLWFTLFAFQFQQASPGSIAAVSLIRVAISLRDSSVSAPFSRMPLFSLASAPQAPFGSFSAVCSEVSFSIVRLTGSLRGLISFGLMWQSPGWPSKLLWNVTLENISVSVSESTILHSGDVVQMQGVNTAATTGAALNMPTTLVDGWRVLFTNQTHLERLGGSDGACFIVAYLNASRVTLSVSGSSVLDGCRAFAVWSVRGGFIGAAVESNSTIITRVNSASNTAIDFRNSNIDTASVVVSESNLMTDYSSAQGASSVYLLDSSISTAFVSVRKSSLRGKLMFTSWQVELGNLSVTFNESAGSTFDSAVTMLRSNATNSMVSFHSCHIASASDYAIESSVFLVSGYFLLWIFTSTLVASKANAPAVYLSLTPQQPIASLLQLLTTNSTIYADWGLELSCNGCRDKGIGFSVVARNTTFDCIYPLLIDQGGSGAYIGFFGSNTTAKASISLYFFPSRRTHNITVEIVDSNIVSSVSVLVVDDQVDKITPFFSNCSLLILRSTIATSLSSRYCAFTINGPDGFSFAASFSSARVSCLLFVNQYRETSNTTARIFTSNVVANNLWAIQYQSGSLDVSIVSSYFVANNAGTIRLTNNLVSSINVRDSVFIGGHFLYANSGNLSSLSVLISASNLSTNFSSVVVVGGSIFAEFQSSSFVCLGLGTCYTLALEPSGLLVRLSFDSCVLRSTGVVSYILDSPKNFSLLGSVFMSVSLSSTVVASSLQNESFAVMVFALSGEYAINASLHLYRCTVMGLGGLWVTEREPSGTASGHLLFVVTNTSFKDALDLLHLDCLLANATAKFKGVVALGCVSDRALLRFSSTISTVVVDAADSMFSVDAASAVCFVAVNTTSWLGVSSSVLLLLHNTTVHLPKFSDSVLLLVPNNFTELSILSMADSVFSGFSMFSAAVLPEGSRSSSFFLSIANRSAVNVTGPLVNFAYPNRSDFSEVAYPQNILWLDVSESFVHTFNSSVLMRSSTMYMVELRFSQSVVSCEGCTGIALAEALSDGSASKLYVVADATNFSGFGALVRRNANSVRLYCNRWNGRWLTTHRLHFLATPEVENVTELFPYSLISNHSLRCPVAPTQTATASSTTTKTTTVRCSASNSGTGLRSGTRTSATASMTQTSSCSSSLTTAAEPTLSPPELSLSGSFTHSLRSTSLTFGISLSSRPVGSESLSLPLSSTTQALASCTLSSTRAESRSLSASLSTKSQTPKSLTEELSSSAQATVSSEATLSHEVTVSASQSMSRSRTLTMLLPGRPIAAPQVALIVSVIAAGSGAATLEASTMAMIGAISCGSPSEKKSESSPDLLMYVLSPFAPLGLEAMLFGNIGLAAMFFTGSLAVIRLLSLRSGVSFDDAARRISFPSRAIKVAQLALNGVTFAGFSLLQRQEWHGIVALLYAVTFVCLAERVRRCISAEIFFEPHGVARWGTGWPARLARAIFPSGIWNPAPLRQRFGAVFSSAAPGRHHLVLHPVVYGVCFAFVASFNSSAERCHIQYAVLAVLSLSLAGFVGVARPFRATASNFLAVLSSTSISCTLWCTVAVLRGSKEAGSAAGIFSVCTTVLLSLKAIYSGAVWLSERRRKERSLPRCNEAAADEKVCDEIPDDDNCGAGQRLVESAERYREHCEAQRMLFANEMREGVLTASLAALVDPQSHSDWQRRINCKAQTLAALVELACLKAHIADGRAKIRRPFALTHSGTTPARKALPK